MSIEFEVDIQQLLSDPKYDFFICVTRKRDGQRAIEKIAGGPGLCATVVNRLKIALKDPVPELHWCHWQSGAGKWHKLEFENIEVAQSFCETLNGAVNRYVHRFSTRKKDD